MTERIDSLKHCVKNVTENIIYLIDDDFFAQYSC